MKTRQELLINVLAERLPKSRVGILVKGVADVSPTGVMQQLTAGKNGFVSVAVGYDCSDLDAETYTLRTRIEEAVKWRSKPEMAGNIVVFVCNDSDKLHSLKELDVVTIRAISERLIEEMVKDAQTNQNMPTFNFWKSLKSFIDSFSFETLYEFARAVEATTDKSKAIPENMWRLGLLCDFLILDAKIKTDERLTQNQQLIIAIGQISEEHRKRMTTVLAKETDAAKKARFQNAYRGLQNFFKYGKKETLKDLDFETVRELLLAAKMNKKPKTGKPGSDAGGTTVSSIREKELGRIIARCTVKPEEGDDDFLQDVYADIVEHFGEENNAASKEIQTKYEDRPIILDNHATPLRRLVHLFCNSENWGGVLETEETTFRDAVSAQSVSTNFFRPDNKASICSCDRDLSLFDCLLSFDEQFKAKGLDNVDHFGDIIAKLKEYRVKLLENIDIVMYFPILGFGVDPEIKATLLGYTKTWADLLRVFRGNSATMFKISHKLTQTAARSLLLLDVLHVKTPMEWKAVLLPLHPIFLWRYSEIFTALDNHGEYSETDIENLAEVFTKLPQVLNFVVIDNLITTDNTNIELPCSGAIEMLPTFENKTNRYLGYDGIECVEEIISRWLAFAPYAGKEIRICTVDAPDHATILKALSDFIEKINVVKIVYQIFLTRDQNGNTEIAKLDYNGKDYETGDLIRSGRLVVNINNVGNLVDIKEELAKHPVHVAFYFDQSSYKIEHGPSTQHLYINPLVVTYDYKFDPMLKRGEIFPSSDMESGIIGDYYRVMRDAELTTFNKVPRPTYNPDADIKDLTSTVTEDKTIWLVAIDRTISNYLPENTIPIGEKRLGLRTYGVWASRDSRIIRQYLQLLRNYNLYPEPETLLNILSEFGHISSNGLISIPRFGNDVKALDNRRKGLIGTIFAAKWFATQHPGALVASLDTDDARLWIRNAEIQREAKERKDERADLIGLYFENEELHIVPIEVKTRDESPDAIVEQNSDGDWVIRGHAADQINAVVMLLKDMFSGHSENMFVSARREVLKYQIVSECFRDSHDHAWQQEWERKLKNLFSKDAEKNLTLRVHGLLLHIKLSDVSAGKSTVCVHASNNECKIELRELTTDDINNGILDSITSENAIIDFDETLPQSENAEVEIDRDLPGEEPTDEPETPSGYGTESVTVPETATPTQTVTPTEVVVNVSQVSQEEIEQLAKDFRRSCEERGIKLDTAETAQRIASRAIVGASLIRYTFKLARGQSIQSLRGKLEDIGREMQRTGVLVQAIPNSSETYLDVPRLTREKVLFGSVADSLPIIDSLEQLPFTLGRTPDGRNIIKDLNDCPHLLVGGSTGSGKTVFLWTLLVSLLKSHPRKEDLQLVISSSGLEDFIRFEGLPHLVGGKVYSDATETSGTICDAVFKEFERRKSLMTQARVENITRYNETHDEKLAPMVVVVDEFADLTDQLSTKKEREDFYKPIRQIAQIGRKRGIHLVLCTQRPSANLLPTDIKAQLGGRIALRVNEATSSRMILDEGGAQDLQKHGDMIYKNGSEIERAQGYLLSAQEVDDFVATIIVSK
jgi:hypothetical protein